MSYSPDADEELPGMLAVAKGVSEQRWPHTMDAAIWAAEYVKRYPGSDEGEMLGWFANAIMAGYDTAMQRAKRSSGPHESPPKTQAEKAADDLSARSETATRTPFPTPMQIDALRKVPHDPRLALPAYEEGWNAAIHAVCKLIVRPSSSPSAIAPTKNDILELAADMCDRMERSQREWESHPKCESQGGADLLAGAAFAIRSLKGKS